MSLKTVGWDVGGAHLKLAGLDGNGRLCWVREYPTPLWQGLESLTRTLDALAEELPLSRCSHGLTMTGELVDLFADRQEGVESLTAAVQAHLPGGLRIYAGDTGFLTPVEAVRQVDAVASANWYASTAWAACSQHEGLFVDIGSTTSDILGFANGSVRHVGYTDRERLASEELVYTGIVRTPVMAVSQRAPFKGDWLGLANEHFATMADVYRVLEMLPADADQHPSADGQAKDLESSRRRLARMIGADTKDGTGADWQQLASYLADRQLDTLSQACRRRVSTALSADAPLIGAGVGQFLVPEIARRLGRPYQDWDALIDTAMLASDSLAPTVCAPAVAVAHLMSLQTC